MLDKKCQMSIACVDLLLLLYINYCSKSPGPGYANDSKNVLTCATNYVLTTERVRSCLRLYANTLESSLTTSWTLDGGGASQISLQRSANPITHYQAN